MDGLKDYIEWLGDFGFDVKPFGDVDAVILCLISYFDLGPALKRENRPGKDARLRDCLPYIEGGELGLRITGGEQGNTAVFKAAAQSRRFGDLKLINYVDRLEPEKDLQFSAVTFEAEGFSFAAFRGTDSTLVGWKEDFMLGCSRTAAQELAFEYARDAIAGDPDKSRRWYIGGHSKGGNLALYAACLLPGEYLGKVERVYDLDGPGFGPDIVDSSLIKRADRYVTKIIPEYCVIGRIMEVAVTDTRIIKSSETAVMQHSIASWGVDHGKLAMSELEKPRDLWINRTITQWIDGLSMEERVSFINEFFDALAAGGAKTIEDLAAGGKEGLDAVVAGFKGFSKTAKSAVTELEAAAAENTVKRLSELIPEAVADTAKLVAENVIPKLQAAAERLNQKGETEGEKKI